MMLRKLRLKFVLINMTIVTIMLCVIFALLYHFTRMDMENKSIAMMQELAQDPFRLGRPGEFADEIQLPYFVLQLGIHGEPIASGGGFYDLSDDRFLKEITSAAFQTSKQVGHLEAYNLRFCRVVTPVNQYMVFVDTSSEQATLQGLLKTSACVGVFSFFGFLGISIFLAQWAVKPVDQAWKQQKQFVSDASHELKTPLTIIMTNAELLQDSQLEEENRNRFAEHILSTSKQMRKLLEQMLELARSDGEEKNNVFSHFDLGQVVSDEILSFEPVFFERGLHLEAQTMPEMPVEGDREQLRQLLDILLDNAQKYSSEGGKTHVELSCQSWSKDKHCIKRKKFMNRIMIQRKNTWILTVSNEGVPMSEEQISCLFQRFYRADEARSRDGSYGLGLFIAEKIVNKHNGIIWAESKDGWNRFFVELPMEQRGR